VRRAVTSFAFVVSFCLAPTLGAQDGVPVGPPMVDDGYPTVVEVSFEGLESYDPEGVLRTLGLTVGKDWPEQLWYRQGVERVFKTYGVVLLQPIFASVPGGVSVVLPVRELPVDLEPRFVGNDAIPEDKLRDWALLYDREQIYVHEADRIRTRVVQGYRRQGYHFAEVEVVVGRDDESKGAAADVIFQVREGPKVRVTRIRVQGNTSLPDTGWGLWRGGLRKMAQAKTLGVGVLRWWGGVFDEEVLEADLVAMAEVYRDRGWVDVRVTVEPYEFTDDRSEVKVTVVVDEGPLYRVRSVKIEAVVREWDSTLREWQEEKVKLLFPEEELHKLLRLRPGLPLESARVARDRSQLGRYYGERGYIPQEYFDDPTAGGWDWLEPVYLWDTETQEVDVVYRFVQGRQRSIREVKFEGNLHTRDRVLRREISALEGERANIREIERGLARLRGTHFFDDQLDLTHPPATVHLEAAQDDPEKVDVIYGVTEGRVVDVNLSGGVTSDSGILGLLSVSMRNFEITNLPGGFWSGFGEIYRKEAFHGNGEKFEIDIAPGSQISYYKFFYRHPDIFNNHFDRWTGSVEFETRLRRYQSHDEKRKDVALGLGRLFGQGDFSITIGPRWQEIELDDLEPADEIPGVLLRSAEAPSEFIGLDLTMRYSQLDNRMSPREGVYMSWGNTVYGGPMGGDNDLWESTYQFDYYSLIGPEQSGVRPGWYLGGEVGVAAPFGDTEETHYSERKFYGGASSLRGFEYRGVGPNEGDYAIGGETFMRLSGEYRYPLYSTPIPGTSERREMLRGFLFVDAAVLDVDSFTLDLEEHRAAVGFGFALTSPIPLKFNFGFPVREGEGDETEVFSFRLDFR
jgi:outer membrane protein insertion porin family